MNKNIRLIAIINAIIMVVWLVIVNAILNIFTLGFYAVMGFIWAIIAFALTEVSVIQWNLRRNQDLTEINFLPYLLTEAYFVIALIINYWFVSAGFLYYPKSVPTVVNVILLAFAVIFRLVLDPYAERVDKISQKTIEKVQNVQNISSQLSTLQGLAESDAVRKKLYGLLEQVKLSSNTTQNGTSGMEERFSEQLDELSHDLENNVPEDKLLEEIDSLSKTWKRRNAVSSDIR